MKNAHSKLATVLSQHYIMRYRLILTGTPLQNNLPELWALLNFLLPDVFNSCKTFEDWFNTPFANTGEKMELNEEEMLLVIRRLHKVLHPFLLRRMKKDVEAELPDKVEAILKCPMSALQSTLYRAITSKSTLSSADTKSLGIRRLNNTIMQLRKICNHPFVFDEVERQLNPYHVNNELLYRVAGKFELLHRILPKFQRSGHKVLMFFQMTQIMTIMEDFLNMLGFKYLRLDGSTKAEDRSDLLKKFNAADSPYFVFLLSTRAGGLGLNLQTADTVIIFDSDWNPHQDLQAQDRAHRIGQTKEVRIFRLITVDSVEEYILKRAQQKLSLDGKIIQAGKFDQRSTNEERDEMLRAILEREAIEDETAEEIYDDEELNEIISRSEEEALLFKKMDEERAAANRSNTRKQQLAPLIELSELPKIYLPAEAAGAEEDNSGAEDARSTGSFDDYIGVTEPRRRRAAAAAEGVYNETMSDAAWLRRLERQQEQESAGNADSDVPSESGSNSNLGSSARKRASKSISPSLTGKIPKLKLTIGAGTAVATQRASSIPALSQKAGAVAMGKPKVGIHLEKSTKGHAADEADEGHLDEDKRTDIMRDIYSLVENCVDETGTRYRSDLFLELPDRTQYADYYRLIKRPICLAMIEDKVSSGAYATIKAFMSDLELIFANAMEYNVEGSQVYEDARVMRQLAQDRLEELLEAEGNFANGTHSNSDDDDELTSTDTDGDEDEDEDSGSE
jgi:ATP-dependent helicase STH1/SNF2